MDFVGVFNELSDDPHDVLPSPTNNVDQATMFHIVSNQTPVIVKTVVEKLGLIVSVYWEIRHELADARMDIDLQVADTA